MIEPDGLSISSVHLRSFKAFRDFSVSLRHMNIFVGPNNAGKSTLIGAFRVLATAVQRARLRGPDSRLIVEGVRTRAWEIPEDAVPVSLENVHTEYEEVDSLVDFQLSNQSHLTLKFPAEGGAYLVPKAQGTSVYSPSTFRSHFPIRIGVVPVLGPVEHQEAFVTDETVKRNLATPRASRNFRNYWYRQDEKSFEDFRERIRTTWPGMDVKRPEIVSPYGRDPWVAMMCSEERIERELYWSGVGFQVWCQIITHLARAEAVDLLVIDEPEIYLHPDVQRQLLGLLRELGPDVVMATHSTEIVAQAEPSDLLLVDKRAKSAKRVTGTDGVRSALARLGSVHNLALTQVARTRRVIFIEGEDFRYLAQFASKLGLTRLSAGTTFATLQTQGFPTVDALRSVLDGIRDALGVPVLTGALFDRDYRGVAEVDAILVELRNVITVPRVLLRKELENYLLSPVALDRAVVRAVQDQSKRTGQPPPAPRASAEALTELSAGLRVNTLIQTVDRAVAFERKKGSHAHEATIRIKATEEFEAAWAALDYRLEIVPGKELLALYNKDLQNRYQVSLTPTAVIREMKKQEIPTDLGSALKDLDALCGRKPP